MCEHKREIFEKQENRSLWVGCFAVFLNEYDETPFVTVKSTQYYLEHIPLSLYLRHFRF